MSKKKVEWADPAMPLEERCHRLNTALNQVLDQKELLEAELAEVKERLAALMGAFEENGTLGILQLMAHDTRLPAEVRIRAAGLAVPFERPKLSMTATTSVPLYDLLEARRRKLIDHTPTPPGA
jgi:hypothetical protein